MFLNKISFSRKNGKNKKHEGKKISTEREKAWVLLFR